MGIDTKIEWTHHTLNLWHGCTKVHEGCDNCYAETFANRFNRQIWGNGVPRLRIASFLKTASDAQMIAKSENAMHRVFVGSMMDIFEKPMPLKNFNGEIINESTGNLRDSFFRLIDLGRYPNLIFLFLTKRPSNINKFIPESWKSKAPENTMFGVSISNDKTAADLIPHLEKVNANRFLSIEPQLGPVNLFPYLYKRCERCDGTGFIMASRFTTDCPSCCDHYPGYKFSNLIDWVIVGGESGHHKRAYETNWGRSLRDQCAKAGVPFFFKQVDKIQDVPEDLRIMQFPEYHNNLITKII